MAVCYLDLDGTLLKYDAPFEAIYKTALESLDREPRELETYSEAFFDTLGDANNPFAAGIAETDVDVDPAAFAEAMIAAEVDHVRAVLGAADALEVLAGFSATGGLLTVVLTTRR